jgi:hypothetical protein
MAIIKNTNITNTGRGGEETPIHCWWEYKLVQPLWKSVWKLLKKLKIKLPLIPLYYL